MKLHKKLNGFVILATSTFLAPLLVASCLHAASAATPSFQPSGYASISISKQSLDDRIISQVPNDSSENIIEVPENLFDLRIAPIPDTLLQISPSSISVNLTGRWQANDGGTINLVSTYVETRNFASLHV